MQIDRETTVFPPHMKKINDRFQDYRQVDQSNGKIMRRIICILITQQYVYDERNMKNEHIKSRNAACSFEFDFNCKIVCLANRIPG